jgi:hypothetical protein
MIKPRIVVFYLFIILKRQTIDRVDDTSDIECYTPYTDSNKIAILSSKGL